MPSIHIANFLSQKERKSEDILVQKERLLNNVLLKSLSKTGNDRLSIKVSGFGMKFKKQLVEMMKERFIEVLDEEISSKLINQEVVNGLLKDLGYERNVR